MNRLIHIWICLAMASCQLPAPSAELDVDEKGQPVLRLTPAEVAGCAQGCKLFTAAELRGFGAQAFSAGYRSAIEAVLREQADKPKEPKCGRDA